jgi:acyl-coenzyme A thioesterase PaaI-like protein
MGEEQDRRDDSHAPIAVRAEMQKTIDERANHCFGCGPENPQGLQLKFELREADGVITATSLFTMTRMHEGPPGYIHGGIIATLLDEAMSKLNRPLNVLAMTRSLTVDYLRPSPLHVPLRLVGKHLRRDGRKVLHSAELQAEDGTVLARGEGFFLVVDAAMLADAGAKTRQEGWE